MPKAPRHGQLKTVAGHTKSVRAPLARVQREAQYLSKERKRSFRDF